MDPFADIKKGVGQVSDAVGTAKGVADKAAGALGDAQGALDSVFGGGGGGGSGATPAPGVPLNQQPASGFPTASEMRAAGLSDDAIGSFSAYDFLRGRLTELEALNIANMQPLAGIAPTGTPLSDLSPTKQRLALAQENLIATVRYRNDPTALAAWNDQWKRQMWEEYDRTCTGLGSALTTTGPSGRVCAVPASPYDVGIYEEALQNLRRVSSSMGSVPGAPSSPDMGGVLSTSGDAPPPPEKKAKWYKTTAAYIGYAVVAAAAGWAFLTESGREWREDTF